MNKLIGDVKTRWNSSHDMMERYLQQEPAIIAALLSKDLRSRQELKDIIAMSEEDVSNTEKLVAMLGPLKTITSLLCSASTPTVSLILPFKDKIMRAMACLPEDSRVIQDAKSAVANDMKKRYIQESVRDYLLQATILDPRFKSLMFLTEDEKHKVQTDLVQLCVNICKTETLKLKVSNVYIYLIY